MEGYNGAVRLRRLSDSDLAGVGARAWRDRDMEILQRTLLEQGRRYPERVSPSTWAVGDDLLPVGGIVLNRR